MVASLTEDEIQDMMIQHLVNTANQRSRAFVSFDSDEDSVSAGEEDPPAAGAASSPALLIAAEEKPKPERSVIQDHMDQHDFFDKLPLIVPVPEDQLFFDLDQLLNGPEARSQRVPTKSVFFHPFFMRHYCVTPPFQRTPGAVAALGNNVWVRALRYPFGRVHKAGKEARRIFPELASAYYIYLSNMPFMGEGMSNVNISTLRPPCSQCGHPTHYLCQCHRQYLCHHRENESCRMCNRRS